MKKEMLKVLYYIYTEYGYKRHVDIMTHDEYRDLLIDEDVIVKRKWNVA